MMIMSSSFFFFNDTATTEIYPYWHTLSLHDALPIYPARTRLGRTGRRASRRRQAAEPLQGTATRSGDQAARRSEEHTSELQSLMRISYAVSCLKKKMRRNYLHRVLQAKAQTANNKSNSRNQVMT